jgi:molecular chaperone DnaK
VHTTRKAMQEYGDKLSADERIQIEDEIRQLEAAIRDADKAAIDKRVAALTSSSQKLGEKMYADMHAQQAAADATRSQAQEPTRPPAAEDVVEAEFKEVKDK